MQTVEYAAGRLADVFGKPSQPTVLLWHGQQPDARSSVRPLGELIAGHGLGVIAPDWNSYSDDGGAYDKTDLISGARLLSQGGLVADPNGTWTSHGTPVSLNLVWASNDPWSESAGPAVEADLVNAGFNVFADPVPESELLGSALPQGAFDLALVPVAAGLFPTSMGDVFSTSIAVNATGTASDWSGFDDPRIDALFTEAAQDLNAASAQTTYRQIDQDLWAAMPSLPLFAEPTLLVTSTSVSGVNNDPGGPAPLWGASTWARLVAAPAKA